VLGKGHRALAQKLRGWRFGNVSGFVHALFYFTMSLGRLRLL
jgi:hypothetical protein